jgi:hypothetical protein
MNSVGGLGNPITHCVCGIWYVTWVHCCWLYSRKPSWRAFYDILVMLWSVTICTKFKVRMFQECTAWSVLLIEISTPAPTICLKNQVVQRKLSILQRGDFKTSPLSNVLKVMFVQVQNRQTNLIDEINLQKSTFSMVMSHLVEGRLFLVITKGTPLRAVVTT